MAELPSLLRVKRKRGQDPAPDLFLQEESTKRQQTWQFRLQQPHPSDTKSDDKGNNSGLPAPNLSAGVDAAAANGADIITSPVRREFRLAIDPSRTAIVGGRKRKAQVEAQDIPTFIEATNKKQRFDKVAAAPSDSAAAHIKDKPSASLKKPGASLGERQWRAENWKNPANQLTPQPPSTQAMDALQQFALEEAAREEVREKPRVTIVPKKPVRRYRDRHPEEFAAADSVKSAAVAHGHAAAIHEDMDMSDDDDYVYDTYVRSKDPVMPPTIEDADPLQYNVGYLVITEQDQPFWETYFEDDESEHEFETDDEDENGLSKTSLSISDQLHC